MQAKTMTNGSPWKHILQFSLPILVGSLLQQLYNTADTIIVGRFSGENALSQLLGLQVVLHFFFLPLL